MVAELHKIKKFYTTDVNDLEKIKLLAQFFRNSINPNISFEKFIYEMESDADFKISFKTSLFNLIKNCELTSSFSENGIISNSSFYSELKNRIKHRIIPQEKSFNSLEFLLQQIFFNTKDYIWVNEITNENWSVLINTISIEKALNNDHLINELLKALQLISIRIAYLSNEKELKNKFTFNDERFYCFIEQQIKINELLGLIKNKAEKELVNIKVIEATELFEKCNHFINEVRELKKVFGTSIYLTFLLLRIEQQIERAQLIIDLADGNNQLDLQKIIVFFKQNIEKTNNKNKIKPLVESTIGYLAYQIVEHEGKTGEHYITTTKKEYKKSFWAAAGGGLIISFTAIIKALFHFISPAAFWQSFLYSVNYALGFVVVYSMHWTIATKQPAMTASALASQLNEDSESPLKLAELIAKISRSQIASFAGNLLVVFPLSYLISWLFFIIFNFKIASPELSKQLIEGQNPFGSGAWFYAAIAGVFLFLSGVITGYFDNLVIYGKIKKRIFLHPYLTTVLKEEKRKKLANYIDNHLGGLMGNITLGFFLGFAIFFGKIFGIPFDIRHITISTANFGIAIFGLDNQLTIQQWLTTCLGLAGIGFINFLTSFSLAFFVALKSRKLKIRNSSEYLMATLKLFLKKPIIFFYPAKEKKLT